MFMFWAIIILVSVWMKNTYALLLSMVCLVVSVLPRRWTKTVLARMKQVHPNWNTHLFAVRMYNKKLASMPVVRNTTNTFGQPVFRHTPTGQVVRVLPQRLVLDLMTASQALTEAGRQRHMMNALVTVGLSRDFALHRDEVRVIMEQNIRWDFQEDRDPSYGLVLFHKLKDSIEDLRTMPEGQNLGFVVGALCFPIAWCLLIGGYLI
jgi:hypothetical protein